MNRDMFSGLLGGVSGVIWPAVPTGRAAVLAALLAELQTTQYLPRAEIEARQYRQLGALAAHCAKYSPHFANRLARAGLTAADVASPKGFSALPVLTRRDVQTAGDSLYCREFPPDHRPLGEIKTSGSTGEPVVIRRTALTNLMWSAMTLREHLWMGRDFEKRLCAIRANVPKRRENPDWGPPSALLYATGPSLALPIAADAEDLARWIAEFDPGTLRTPSMS